MGEVCSFSGILKIIEIVLVFITIVLHRHGDNGRYIFFATSNEQLQYNSSNRGAINMENLGNGTLVTFLIITPVLLICYVLDGQYEIQKMFLEWIWNLVGACCFLGIGVKSAYVWTAAKGADTFTSWDDYARNYDAALTMAAFCIISGIVYFVDFVVAYLARKRIAREYDGAPVNDY